MQVFRCIHRKFSYNIPTLRILFVEALVRERWLDKYYLQFERNGSRCQRHLTTYAQHDCRQSTPKMPELDEAFRSYKDRRVRIASTYKCPAERASDCGREASVYSDLGVFARIPS